MLDRAEVLLKLTRGVLSVNYIAVRVYEFLRSKRRTGKGKSVKDYPRDYQTLSVSKIV